MTRKAFDKIAEGLNEALAIAEGKASPARLRVPAEMDVRAIRTKLHMTQSKFASAFGLPLTTLRDWEQGRARPETFARAYLKVIERRPEMVKEALQDEPPTV
jgi:putative transcriptional regulator